MDRESKPRAVARGFYSAIRIVARALLGLLALLVVGCSVIFFHEPTRYTSTSPDGKYALRFGEKCGFDCMIHIYADRGLVSEQIGLGNDCTVGFIHVSWAGPVAVAFVDGGACPNIKLAYDFDAHVAVEFRSYEARLRDDIIRSWNVLPQELEACKGDVLEWASSGALCSNRPFAEFRARYPQTWLF